MKSIVSRSFAAVVVMLLSLGLGPNGAMGAATLADQPVFSSTNVPGNLALALSVEYPTAISVANLGDYSDGTEYLGYFDPRKCYSYIYNSGTPASSYFKPAAFATGSNLHICSGKWSGNFMNWATMQTIDPFRSALTGGFRSLDGPSQTILEKAWGSQQGDAADNFPYRGVGQPTGNNVPAASVPQVTPFSSWSALTTAVWGLGNQMNFASTGYSNGNANYTGGTTADPNTVYSLYVRVDVCDPNTALGTAGLESNCVQYGSVYKPQGLMQQYANKIRFSVFGYPLDTSSNELQGALLREPMGFIGPTYPQPLSPTPLTNTRPEWDAMTGIMSPNPDGVSALASGVTQSGVMNYLNKFGEANQYYMIYDDVSILYYGALRYFENLGNVPDWSNGLSNTQLDNFPAVTAWIDPVSYSCQKNFILGIGDDHTWDDYNVGGGNATGGFAKPAAVSADTFNKAATWTTEMQTLEGITPSPWWPAGASNATYYIAGLAYGAHVINLRPDLTGLGSAAQPITPVTISTYWMDVAEKQEVENLNPYYLAAKYGGFAVPSNYSLTNTTPLPQSEWYTTGLPPLVMNGGNSHLQPDNYFVTGNASQMVASLTSAFTNIASALKAFTTSFALPAAVQSASGATSFSAQYSSDNWTGTVISSTVTFDSSGNPLATAVNWDSDSSYAPPFAGTGWDTNRSIYTWNGSTGVAFRTANLSSAQRTALSPSYSSTLTCNSTTCPYLNYIRGDRSNEVASTSTGSTHSLRTRTLLLGDIVDSKVTSVGPPSMSYSEVNDPGYTAYRTGTASSRDLMVYFGDNDGLLHGFDNVSGTETFGYVPSAIIQGPSGTPQVDGLVQYGNPNYSHHYYVDATPLAFDVDFNNSGGAFATTSSANSDWRTILIGGLGKGGKSYYAIDVSAPSALSPESSGAQHVLWEFTDPTMGFSFGAPIAIKTVKYGWVIVLTSGYNNSDGFGYIYLVNPKTGALLEKVATPLPSSGLTQASAYVKDYTDFTADSIYVGDLNGQLWRFDLTEAKGNATPYPTPTLMALLTDGSGNAQPVTTAPLIEIYPTSRLRFVMLGTGKLLASTDVASTAAQDFYAIIDGTASAFNSISTPIIRTMLTPVTNVTTGVTLAPTAKGWYTDLGTDSTSGIGWRVILNPVAYNGVVSFSDLLTSANACSPGGQSRVYALNYASGTSVLTNNTTGYYSDSYAITDLKIIGVSSSTSAGADGTPEIVAGDSFGQKFQVPAKLTGTNATRILNWREIPTVD